MRGRRQGSEYADKQQYTKTEADFREAVALERAQCRRLRQPRRQVKTVHGGNGDHGDKQADLEANQPPIVGRHEIAGTAQQIPAVDETACQYSPDAEDADNREAAGHSNCKIVPSRLRPAARLRKQQDERRQAAEPCAGRKQMHHVGDEVEVSGHSRRRPGMADQCGQGDQGHRCGKLKTLRRRPRASIGRAAARARAACTTPARSAYRIVPARRHRAGRHRRMTRRECRTLSSISQAAPDRIATASASQPSTVSR